MNKTLLILSREYFTRVKKKSFLLTTILVPVIIIAFYAIIISIAISDETEKQSIGIIDEAGLFNDKIETKNKSLHFEFIQNESEQSFIPKYRDLGYQAFLYIPPFNINTPGRIALHSQSSLSLSTTSAVEKVINKAIEDKRLQAQGIDPEKYKAIASDISIENTIDTKEGSKKSVAAVAYGVSYACGILIYMMMLIYGTQVMRGVMEEKTSRIAEVIISSVKPFQLMMGKILGIGAVGLTQFAIWIILIVMLQFAIPVIFPDMLGQLDTVSSSSEDVSMAVNVVQGISSLPLMKILFSFIFYFLGGYLTYASLFAAIGSVSNDDQQDAQQMVFPILMPIILGFVIMSRAVNDPHSSLAVFGSLFPLTSPIVMMGRITYHIPAWELALSMLLLVGCFIFFTWITSRIYRTGILMYGKKPGWKEMIKWGFRRS